MAILDPSGRTPVGVAGVKPRGHIVSLLTLAVATVLFSRPASAQMGGLLPNLGGSPQVGDLRPQLEHYFKQEDSTAARPNWVFQPSIEVDVGATDNALLSSSGKKADLYTTILPSIVVSGDTARVKVNLGYAPNITHYLTTNAQNSIGQNGNGQALITLAPDTFFLDLRGSASQQSGGNGFAQQQAQSYNQQYNVQTITVSATPYVEHRFGGWGTGRVGFSIARTLQNTPTGQNTFNGFNNGFNATTPDALAALQSANNTQGYGALGNLTTKRERASFTTGENLGRYNDIITLEANQFSGVGSYVGAYRNEIQNEFGFALTRSVTLLSGLGYQDIYYSGFPAVRINEPTFNFGVRLTPDPDTSITILYGRRDGAPSISFDGQAAPTSRTRVVVRYSTGITSDAENAQNVLDQTSVGATGQLVDTVTGAPVGGVDGYGGIQNGIYRVRRLSVSGSLLQLRDTFSVGLTNEDRTTLTNTTSFFNNANILAGTNSNTTYATLGWQHELTPDMRTDASVQYGITTNPAQFVGATNQTQRTFSVSAGLSKQFTETLSGSVRYILTDQSGGQFAGAGSAFTGTYTQNTLLVSLRKGF